MDAYLRKEREGGRFSFEDILSDELRLDRDEGEKSGGEAGAPKRGGAKPKDS
jgi:hypothetical protein